MPIDLYIWFDHTHHRKYFVNRRGQKIFGEFTEECDDIDSLLKYLESAFSSRKAYLLGVSDIEKDAIIKILNLIDSKKTKIQFKESVLEQRLRKKAEKN